MKKNSKSLAKARLGDERENTSVPRRKGAGSKKKRLLKLDSIKELEARLSPEARKQLEEIRALRKAMGPVPFKVRDLIREIRDK